MNRAALLHRQVAAGFVFLALAAASALEGATVTSQWNFDDPANAGSSVANVGGFLGTFVGVADRTASGAGVSGTAGDYSLDIRALGNGANGGMTSHTAAFLSALNAATGSQSMSITYWEFVDSTPASTAFWGNSPSAVGGGGTRGLNAHSPWSDGNLYFDTAGCCDASTRISGPMGATLGEWQHVSLIYNNGTREAYRNSTLVASGAGGVPLATDFDAFYIGNDSGLTGLGMDARLDNFTVWNGALTLQEVAALSVRPVPEPTAGLLVLLVTAASVWRRSRSR